MPRDRDQLTPDEPADRELLESSRLQGRGGTGDDVLPGEAGSTEPEDQALADGRPSADEWPPADDERPPGGEEGDGSPA